MARDYVRNWGLDTQAVAAGGDVPILVAPLRSADNRRRELSARLVLQDASEDLNPAALADLRARLRGIPPRSGTYATDHWTGQQ